MQLNIVLHEPEIPPNTGNIVRTCAALGARLHLIEPLGFKIDDATVRRAGLDYWDSLEIFVYKNLEDFEKRAVNLAKVWMLSTKAAYDYSKVQYQDTDIWLLFGKETRGLPEDILKNNLARCIRIPMNFGIRSLNLSNAVAICAYEVARQHQFAGLQNESNYLENKGETSV